MYIGDIEIPIVFSVEKSKFNEVDEIASFNSYNNSVDRVAVKHDSAIKTLVFNCYLNEAIHSTGLSLKKQRQEIKKLCQRNAEENRIDEMGYSGHLLVKNVDLRENGDNSIVNEVEITADYFPWPKYYSEIEFYQ